MSSERFNKDGDCALLARGLPCDHAHEPAVSSEPTDDEIVAAVRDELHPASEQPPAFQIVTTATSTDGTRFALIEDEKEQHVFTWRDDDADAQAVFSECAVNSITARDIIEFANDSGTIQEPVRADAHETLEKLEAALRGLSAHRVGRDSRPCWCPLSHLTELTTVEETGQHHPTCVAARAALGESNA